MTRTPGRGPHPLSLLLAMAARQTGGAPDAMADFLAGLDRYQRAPTGLAPPPLAVVARHGGVALRRLAGADAGVRPGSAPAVVLVPSLINTPRVLDMGEGRSLLRYLGSAGHDVHLVDWGNGLGSERRLGLPGMVSVRLLPLLRRLGRPVVLIGYCLGGTLALAAAHQLGAGCAGLVLLAAPWHSDGYPPEARGRARGAWRAIAPIGKALGAIPISMLNPMFWALDEAGVIAKYRKLAGWPEGDPRIGWFAAVEDWANGGAPLSLPGARDLFEHGFGRDVIGRGRWRVAGRRIQPAGLACPVLDVGATGDRIVPDAARLRAAGIERWTLPSGHVGMIIGSDAPDQLWRPLSNWLSSR